MMSSWRLRLWNLWRPARATIPLGDIPRTWKPALDRVWAFLKTRRDLDPGHNLFLYHHPTHRFMAM
jgi:hypothetical protein